LHLVSLRVQNQELPLIEVYYICVALTKKGVDVSTRNIVFCFTLCQNYIAKNE
jgi:hypothetical protein